MPRFSTKMEALLILQWNSWKKKSNFSCSAPFQIKTKISLKFFLNYCLWKEFLILIHPRRQQTYFLRPFRYLSGLSHCFNLKLEQLDCKKVLKFAFVDNCFSDPFTEVEIWYHRNFTFLIICFLEKNKKI